MCNLLAMKHHCSWTYNVTGLLFQGNNKGKLLAEETFSALIVLCGGPKPYHSNHSSHHDGAELPRGHTLWEIPAAVKQYWSNIPKVNCSSQPLKQRHFATLTHTKYNSHEMWEYNQIFNDVVFMNEKNSLNLIHSESYWIYCTNKNWVNETSWVRVRLIGAMQCNEHQKWFVI